MSCIGHAVGVNAVYSFEEKQLPNVARGKTVSLEMHFVFCSAQSVFSWRYQVVCIWMFMKESHRYVLLKITEIFSVMI